MALRTLTGFIWLRIGIKEDCDNVGLPAISTEGREFVDRVKAIRGCKMELCCVELLRLEPSSYRLKFDVM